METALRSHESGKGLVPLYHDIEINSQSRGNMLNNCVIIDKLVSQNFKNMKCQTIW